MSTGPLPTVRDHLSEVVDRADCHHQRVDCHHQRVVVTRNGRDAAVLISPDDVAEMEETIDVLSDPGTLGDIREADQAYARGDVVRGVDAVRLRDDLAGVWSARRGTSRIPYRVFDEPREVVVLRIAHRRGVYRPR